MTKVFEGLGFGHTKFGFQIWYAGDSEARRTASDDDAAPNDRAW